MSQAQCSNFENPSQSDSIEVCWSLFGLKYVPKGYYMLELETDQTQSKTVNRIIVKSKSNTQEIVITSHARKMVKRLIRCEGTSTIQLIIPQSYSLNTKVRTLKLIRVTYNFAKKRMLQKLTRTQLEDLSKNHSTSEGILDKDLLWNLYDSFFIHKNNQDAEYRKWIARYESPPSNLQREEFFPQPLISIIMPVYNPNIEWLFQAIESVKAQSYTNWELCIADDASTTADLKTVLNSFCLSDHRIKVIYREENGHISAASNSALELAKGEWIALLDQDDLIPAYALAYVVKTIHLKPDSQMIYSDEDKVDEDNNRLSPYFKPEWNRDLFYSQNMFSHFGVFKHTLVTAVGGFKKGLEGSQDYDLALRCLELIQDKQVTHIPKILYHWRIHANSTASSADSKPYASLAGENALNQHFKRLKINATAKTISNGSYKIVYKLPLNPPLVTLIIPTRNHYLLLKKCVDSILRKTNYDHYEILIIDNGSDDAQTLTHLNKLSKSNNIRVIRDDSPFNYSALNNKAVDHANGEVIGFINNDVEVITPKWLDEMVSHVLRPRVGAVGAKLLYSDNTIQHGGIILGLGGDICGHAHKYLTGNQGGYGGRAGVTQSLSAVTGACLVMRKDVFQEAGGLNEVDLPVGCSDIDLCLKIKAIGYTNIWTPFAQLYHHESLSRGLNDSPERKRQKIAENNYMVKTWGNLLTNDPAYNPNLSLDVRSGFLLAWPPSKTIYDD